MIFTLKRKSIRVLFPLLFLISAFGQLIAEGQDNAGYVEPPGWQFGVTTGPFLPSRVSGVTEILPFWGLSISTDISVFRPEMTLYQAHAKGLDYFLGIFGFRNELPLYDFHFFWTWGISYSYFTRYVTTSRVSDIFTTNGGLIGSVGTFWRVNDSLRFRFESMMGLGPGRIVHVNIGLQYSFGSEKESNSP